VIFIHAGFREVTGRRSRQFGEGDRRKVPGTAVLHFRVYADRNYWTTTGWEDDAVRILTKAHVDGRAEHRDACGVAKVPEPRLVELAKLYNPKKIRMRP